MDRVFLLWHEYEISPDRDETKLLGVFTSTDKAQAAKQYYLTQPGFRDHPDDFEIAEYRLDERTWSEGFVTVD
jgi:homoserine kinase type II